MTMRSRIAVVRSGMGLLLIAFLYLNSLSQSKAYIPVLCYHGFTDDNKSGRGESYERFDAFLNYLSNKGYESCFPDDIVTGTKAAKNKVIFTFDDGGKSQVRAAELLDKYGFKGIFFVIPDRIAEAHDRFLTKGEIQQLADHGHLIGVHGYQHKSLVDSVEEFERSQEYSKSVLKTVVGEKQRAMSDFAFPFGYYDDRVVEHLDDNYRYLHTVNPGYWDGSSILIPRILIDSHTDINFFIEYVEGATAFKPMASLITQDGTTSDVVQFRLHNKINPAKMALFSVSRDTSGKTNISHPLGDNLMIRDGVLRIDIKNHLRSYYSPDRRVISYALVSKEDAKIRFLTFGHLHWVTE